MTILKKLVFITALCITSSTQILCNENDPRTSIDAMTTTAVKKMIELKNGLEGHYQSITPYIYNPVGFLGAALLASVIGFRKIAAAVFLIGVIAESNKIIHYLKATENNIVSGNNNPTEQKS